MPGRDPQSPEVLERAADRLDALAHKLVQIANSTKSYAGKITPIASGIASEVGGSATGKDKQIAGALAGCARDVNCSAAASQQAAQEAKRAADEARSRAQEIRRQQEAERQSKHSAARR